MTDEQRKRGDDINARAEPLFRELARVEEIIRHLRQKIYEAQYEQKTIEAQLVILSDERNKIEKQLAILSDEKSDWWEEVFAAMEG